MNAITMNEVFEVPEVPNMVYVAELREMDLKCIWDTIVDPAKCNQVYWDIEEGIRNVYQLEDAKR